MSKRPEEGKRPVGNCIIKENADLLFNELGNRHVSQIVRTVLTIYTYVSENRHVLKDFMITFIALQWSIMLVNSEAISNAGWGQWEGENT